MNNYEFFLDMVSKDGATLRHVPVDLMDDEMVHVAVRKNSYALKYVPENLITKDMCDYAVYKKYQSLQ